MEWQGTNATIQHGCCVRGVGDSVGESDRGHRAGAYKLFPANNFTMMTISVSIPHRPATYLINQYASVLFIAHCIGIAMMTICSIHSTSGDCAAAAPPPLVAAPLTRARCVQLCCTQLALAIRCRGFYYQNLRILSIEKGCLTDSIPRHLRSLEFFVWAEWLGRRGGMEHGRFRHGLPCVH